MGEANQLRDEVLRYLSAHHSMTLATTANGHPWAAAVFYVHDERLNLYFLSDDKTRHCRELQRQPLVAATVNDDPDDWHKIKGIQVEGHARKVNSPIEKTKALTLYLGKFPFVKGFISSPLAMLSRVAISGKAFPVDVYKVVPDRVFYLDNEKGFSHREELVLE